jgi:inner membrane protein YidH
MSAQEKTKPTLDRSTELALSRTVLAHQRTLMAWIRTAASLISFGFTVYKFFEYLVHATFANLEASRPHLVGPRVFALSMIFIGIFSLVFATLDYRHEMNILEADYGPVRRSVVGKTAGLVAILGLALFVMVLIQA